MSIIATKAQGSGEQKYVDFIHPTHAPVLNTDSYLQWPTKLILARMLAI